MFFVILSDTQVRIVADGLSLQFAFTDIARQGSVEDLYSYNSFRSLVFRFLDYLKAKNLNLVCMCTDSLYDDDKAEEYSRRYVQRLNSVRKYWDSEFTVNGSSFCFVLIRLWL